jgi:hypothetical protein
VHEVEDRGHQGGYQPRSWAGRGPAGTAGGLPVGHHDLDRTVGAVQDEHRRRGQVAVYDTMAVGVADCFADLAQQVELGGEWDALRMVCEPEVEAAELGAQRVDQADAELGLDQISRPQDAVVVEGLDSAELVLADLPASALVIDRGAGRAHQEPDPRVLLPGHPVVGGPVLPAVALVEGLVVDDPRTGLAAPMRSISRAMISDRLVLMKYRASVSRAPAGVS